MKNEKVAKKKFIIDGLTKIEYYLLLFIFISVVLSGGDANLYSIKNSFFIMIGTLGIAFTIIIRRDSFDIRNNVLAMGIFFAVVIMVSIQIVPIANDAAKILVGDYYFRKDVLQSLNIDSNYLSISVDPSMTVFAGLQFIIPVYMLMSANRLSSIQFERVMDICIAIFCICFVIGLIQVSTGGAQAVIYNNSHKSFFTGIFANRNHCATFTCIMFIIISWKLKELALSRRLAKSILFVLALFCFAIIISTTSRAGVLVFLISFASVCYLNFQNIKIRRLYIAVGLVGAATTAVTVIYVDSVLSVFERFYLVSEDDRWWYIERSLKMAHDFLPFGSGLGNFVPVFKRYEELGELNAYFVNHAHNEYVELLVEMGILSVPIFLGLIAISLPLAKRFIARDNSLESYIFICVAIVMIHSFFDYPMRTQSIAAIIALLVGYAWQRKKV